MSNTDKTDTISAQRLDPTLFQVVNIMSITGITDERNGMKHTAMKLHTCVPESEGNQIKMMK
jgi:hypothetical protein